ncbi:sugar transferase [Sphingomonas kyeonggiensis]|uniref:Lipopolysaccharide/colanic/teichoic acid biosynthesis glycosyltransferase n=1 Tax=Sphingomonas kyeonggiensis TaxID=1268553 RepID=A0A7W6NY27_9SPHN|nr:sugar transferase [Sphingomonas kyeonggiensis]MBB4099938.1 lipopolysaccharide/colanic/teichoic acid biosynthesis glycosyltransferase [Sphingomonas kyeonggiensis]
MIKRLFDIVAAGSALLLLSPVLVPVVIVLLLTGEHEVFYRQERIGRGGKLFGILKFATMLKNSATLPGGDITVRGDPRVLPVGQFLRKTKINELPQLINVLFGDMSLIGYRPLTPRVAAMFPDEHWKAIAHLRPGLSGIGSIVFRDEERILDQAVDREAVYREVIAPYKAALERWYAVHAGLWTDVKLISLTLAAIVKPDLDIGSMLPDLPPPPEALRAK